MLAIIPRIRFLASTVVDEVYDIQKQEVTGLKLRNVCTGDTFVFPVSAMFLGIGHIPNTRAFVGQLEMDDDGYLKTRDQVFTNIPGIFACGDVQDRRYRQAITSPVRVVWPLSKWKSSWKNMDGSPWPYPKREESLAQGPV